MTRPRNRLARLIRVLDLYGCHDVEGIAATLECSPQTIRRDIRDLREAGALGGVVPRASERREHAG